MKTILKYSMYLLAVLGLFTLIYTLRDYIKVLDPSYINLLATIVLVIVTTIYTYQTTKHVRGDLGPKLYVTQNKIESHQKFENYAIQKEYIHVEEKREKGFSNWITDSTNWKMNLINNGKAPATEIVIKYTLKFMKMEILIMG